MYHWLMRKHGKFEIHREKNFKIFILNYFKKKTTMTFYMDFRIYLAFIQIVPFCMVCYFQYCEITFIRGVPIFVERLIRGIKNPTNNETLEAV